MKLSRTIMAVLLGLTISSPSAWACEPPSSGVFSWIHHWTHPDTENDKDSHEKEKDHQKGSGHDCPGGTKGGSSTTTPTSPKG